jgi:hypothetical protein
VSFNPIDRYLLDGSLSKTEAIAQSLATRSAAPAAAPLYRGLEAVGGRAADEALVALRLAMAGRPTSDENVRRLRGLAALARGAAAGDEAAVEAAFKRDPVALDDLRAGGHDRPALAAEARRLYTEALGL